MLTRKRAQTSNASLAVSDMGVVRRTVLHEPCPLDCVNQNGKRAIHGPGRCPKHKKQLANVAQDPTTEPQNPVIDPSLQQLDNLDLDDDKSVSSSSSSNDDDNCNNDDKSDDESDDEETRPTTDLDIESAKNPEPMPSNALERRHQAIKEKGQHDEKLDRQYGHIHDNRRRGKYFSNKRTWLGKKLWELGAKTGCYGFLYLSK